MSYNLSSPNGLLEPCKLDDLGGWFAKELTQIPSGPELAVLQTVEANLIDFVHWADEALLLWPGCDRIPEPGKKQKYFSYPDHLRKTARAAGVSLDTRPNGPAITSFLLAGGQRPKRFGSSNAWSIHHLYSGKFPYHARQSTMHAAKDCNHFTQSADLVAVHPVADAISDEFPFFAWLLRAKAYLQFGYDPDRAFCSDMDSFGFAAGRHYRVIASPFQGLYYRHDKLRNSVLKAPRLQPPGKGNLHSGRCA